MLLRLFGAKVGRKVRVFPNVKIWAPWNVELQENCTLGDGVDCYSVGKVTVGKHATISQQTVLCTASHDYSQLHLPLTVGGIAIGDYAWLTAQVFVMPGVSIGEGAVVGVRSTVFKDIPSWKMAVGTPCRVVGDRSLTEPYPIRE